MPRRVVPGMVATIVADGLPNAAISGKVAWVSPRMSRKTLWSDEPEERFDTKVREVLIRLDDGVPALIVGLRVDALIDSESTTDDSRVPSKAPEVVDSSLAVRSSP